MIEFIIILKIEIQYYEFYSIETDFTSYIGECREECERNPEKRMPNSNFNSSSGKWISISLNRQLIFSSTFILLSLSFCIAARRMISAVNADPWENPMTPWNGPWSLTPSANISRLAWNPIHYDYNYVIIDKYQ